MFMGNTSIVKGDCKPTSNLVGHPGRVSHLRWFCWGTARWTTRGWDWHHPTGWTALFLIQLFVLFLNFLGVYISLLMLNTTSNFGVYGYFRCINDHILNVCPPDEWIWLSHCNLYNNLNLLVKYMIAVDSEIYNIHSYINTILYWKCGIFISRT